VPSFHSSLFSWKRLHTCAIDRVTRNWPISSEAVANRNSLCPLRRRKQRNELSASVYSEIAKTIAVKLSEMRTTGEKMIFSLDLHRLGSRECLWKRQELSIFASQTSLSSACSTTDPSMREREPVRKREANGTA
jgi:hypothetical protein